jgi:hypothetical protein
MTTRTAALLGGSALKLGASVADELDRASAGLHPRPQLLDARERRKCARRIVTRGQVVAQDALSGAVDVLMVARGILGEPLERLALKSYRPGHRRHERSLSTPALNLESRWCGRDTGARISKALEGQSRAAGHKPLTPALRFSQSPAPS